MNKQWYLFIYFRVPKTVHITCKCTPANILSTPIFWSRTKFVRQYNKLLLHFVYLGPALFIGWKFFVIFCLFQSFDLNTYIVYNFYNLDPIYQDFLCFRFRRWVLLPSTCKWINKCGNKPHLIRIIYHDSESNLEAAVWSWATLY